MQEIEGFAGTTPETFDGSHDVTHVAVPLRVRGTSLADARRNAKATGLVIGDAVARVPFVEWITDPAEGAYALLANALTAMESLSDVDRLRVVVSSESVGPLREMIARIEAEAEVDAALDIRGET